MSPERLAAVFREIAQDSLSATRRELWERAAAACEAEAELTEARAIIRFEDGKPDDVVISGDLFRMERMDTNAWWVCIYRGDKRVSFSLRARGRIDCMVTEDELGCVDDR